jgi:hypothetical protein
MSRGVGFPSNGMTAYRHAVARSNLYKAPSIGAYSRGDPGGGTFNYPDGRPHQGRCASLRDEPAAHPGPGHPPEVLGAYAGARGSVGRQGSEPDQRVVANARPKPRRPESGRGPRTSSTNRTDACRRPHRHPGSGSHRMRATGSACAASSRHDHTSSASLRTVNLNSKSRRSVTNRRPAPYAAVTPRARFHIKF